MTQVDRSLEELKARMSEEQRRDMAELISSEVKRRANEAGGHSRQVLRPASKSGVKNSAMSGGLPPQAVGEMYAGMEEQIRALRLKKLQAKENKMRSLISRRDAAVGLGPRLSFLRGGMRKNALLMCAVVLLAVLKIAVDSGGVDAAIRSRESVNTNLQPSGAAVVSPSGTSDSANEGTPQVANSINEGSSRAMLASTLPAPTLNVSGNFNAAERQVLTELDARRVELEKRKQSLDQRESELKVQAQVVNDRIAELRALSTKIITVRKERDSQYESRLEQLANVYGSMAPNEAAPLMAKLDNETSIALLRRMPGKRMGQILSLMDQERAVALTKILTDKGQLEEIPAR